MSWDRIYWGEEYPSPEARWGTECARGIRYQDSGSPAPSGTKGVVRKISTGRKARGMASDDYRAPTEKALD